MAHIVIPTPGPGDHLSELGGSPILGSEVDRGVVLIGMPRAGKSSAEEGLLRHGADAGASIIAVDFEGNLAHRLEFAAREGYAVKRVDVSPRDSPVGIHWRNLWRSASKRLTFFQKFAPVNSGSNNAFFDATTQAAMMAAAAVLVFFGKGKGATLANLIRLLDWPELLHACCEKTTHIKSPFRSLGFRGRSARDVVATIDSRTYALRIFAALDERAKEKWDPLSLVHGAAHAAVLVFNDVYAAALSPVLAGILDVVLIEKISHIGVGGQLLAGIDEAPSLGKLDSLVAAMRRGTKARCAVILTAHSPAGLIAKYGKEEAEDLLALPAWRVYFRQGSPEAAKHASEMLGVVEVLERIRPEVAVPSSKPGDSPQLMYGLRITDRANVHPDELRRCPLASWERDEMSCYVDGPDRTRAAKGVPFRHLVETPEPPPKRRPAPDWWEELRGWKNAAEITKATGISPDLIAKATKLRKRSRGKQGGEEEGRQR